MRRCAISIPSNIAEGNARRGDIEIQRFLKIAFGSRAEPETQLIIAKHLGFISVTDFGTVHEELIEVRKMLNALMSALKITTNS